jgi:uncharacterized membrane protein YhhN
VNATVLLLLVLMGSVAVVDWIAVQLGSKKLEYVAKPLTMVFLIAAVVAMDTTNATARTCFLVALTFSLVGDIFLMLPDRERWFVFGLGAFLIGHLAYIPGLWALGVSAGAVVVGLLVVGLAMATLGRHIVTNVRRSEPALAIPVTVYMIVISLMVASAIGTQRPVAIIGAVLFYCSDALIAWNGFIKEYAWGRLAIMVTYHLGQLGLALSLVT